MPIDIASGRATLDYEDISIPGRVALTWNRRYATALLDKPATSLGVGWTCRYFSTLTENAGEFVFITPEGASEALVDVEGVYSKGGVVRHFGAFLEVFRDGYRRIVQSWNVESGEVSRYCFGRSDVNGSSKLLSIEDATGHGLDVKWDEHGRLAGVRQRVEGRELVFGYNTEGFIEGVFLRSQNGDRNALVRYEYDAEGRQIAAHDAAGFVDRFEYDRHGRLTREIVKDGGVFHYRYDDKGRCVMRSGLNHYNEKRLRYIDGIHVTEVTDSYDCTFTYHHLPSGQAILETDPLGGRRTTEYDDHGRIIAKTDSTGNTTSYAYDDQGNRTSIVDALGHTTTFTFNSNHQPLTMIDACGGLWQRIYDDKNNLIATVDPLRNRWSYKYDADGNVAEIVNPNGARKRQIYRSGILETVTDWLGNLTHFKFDAFGRVVERRGALGDVTRIRYDVLGKPVQVTLPDGAALKATYDHAGNLTHFIDANGSVTRWRYGPCNRLLECTDQVGGTVRYIWGSERGRLEQIVNENGETCTFGRDDCGRIVQERSFDDVERSFRYNAEGHCIAYSNGNGESVTIERDALNRVIGQALPDGERVTFAFDELGRMVEAVNASIGLTFERDAVGRVVRERQGAEWVTSRYDAAGNVVRTETSLGQKIDYEVNANGFITRLTVLGKEAIECERNPYGQETLRRMPGGARLEQRYDDVGRLVGQQVISPRVISEANGPTISRDAELVRRSYDYDRNGALTRMKDGRWGEVEYAYDPAERLLHALRERGTSERFVYDGPGSVIQIRADGQRSDDETLAYGPGNRLVKRGGITYEYDGEGRRIKTIEPSGDSAPKEWHYQWNALGRLVSVTRPDGEVWRYKYDALARRIGKYGPNHVQHFVWNRDVIVHDRRDQRSPSTWLFDAYSFSPILTIQDSRAYVAINDNVGTPRELVDESGQVAWSLSSRTWGGEDYNLPIKHESVDCTIRFQGQWHDAESGLHYNLFRYYDPRCASFISEDPIALSGGLNLYQYVRNTTGYVDPLGLCDKQAGTPPVNVLPSSGSTFIASPDGVVIVAPAGATGPVPNVNPKGNVTGFAFTGGSGGPGLDPRVTDVRIMDPTPPRGASPGYPAGYAAYSNANGQGVNPATGQTIPNSDPMRHTPLK